MDDVDNNISLYAFRLLVEDLLVLFQVLNEAIVNILEHYFAMKKSDARTSLEIYKRFARQTEETISFLDRARRLQHELSISIPSVKHVTIIINLYRSLLIFCPNRHHYPWQQLYKSTWMIKIMVIDQDSCYMLTLTFFLNRSTATSTSATTTTSSD